jgi:hypothetical protein
MIKSTFGRGDSAAHRVELLRTQREPRMEKRGEVNFICKVL